VAQATRRTVFAPTLWAALAVGALCAAPVGWLALRALESGGRTWSRLFTARSLELLGNTLALTVGVTLGCLLLALPAAWLTARTDLPHRRAWTVLLCLPLAVPTYVMAYVLLASFGEGGALNLGVPVYGFPGATLALTLTSFPYVFLPARAALLRMDPSLEEAARLLGASGGSAFFRVTLPLLRPALVSGALLVALYALSDFGSVSLLQFDVFSRAIYVQYEGAFDRGFAAVLSLALAAVALGVLVLGARLRGGAVLHRRSAGAARSSRPVRLGRWTAPALVGLGALVLSSVGLPFGVTLGWLWARADGWVGGAAEALLWPAARTFWASALAALVTAALALPVALVVVRRPSFLSAAVERLAYLGFALPPLVLGLSLVFLGLGAVPVLYGTLAMLVLGYAVRFVSQALGSTESALRQVPPRLEEVAATLGAGRWRRFRSVTLPLLRPGMLAGAALVLLSAMKELPVTLLLAPLGYSTLATGVWSAAAEGRFGEAALPSLALLGVSSVSVAVVLWHEEARA
jgi:iron(III) transport system permease protein